jgi:tetratricopeptide (TPR) repeat protein
VVIGSWLVDYPEPALAHLSAYERTLTMLAASREWLRLLVWPSLLSFSYSPPYLAIVTAPTPAIFYGVALVTAVAVSIALTFRRAPAIAFGLLWLAITLVPVANIFFVSGVFIAERTLFAPSVGFVLVVGGVAQLLWSRMALLKARRVAIGFAGLVLLAGTIRSAMRQRDWFDTGHIATAAVRDLPNAYTVDALYGEYLATRRAAGTAEKWLRRSIALYPDDPEVHVELANLYVNAHLWPAAESTFRKALEIDPNLSSARAGLVLCLVQTKDYAGARQQAQIGVASGESAETFKQLLAAIDSASKTR